ncbi:MAG: helix-turn-helix domain-containing protein [Lachnospiraceae bacterium]|nr:helix-turn-helix domain-containing protein [Lachnospiraceae bacterium]
MSNRPIITLTTQKQFDIYMNPQRQRLLKTLLLTGPMTPKKLSDILHISASSVSYHIKQLEQLGLVALDHTESIHGIQAKFYKALPVMVNLGCANDDDLAAERYAMMDYIMSDLWNSFKENLKQTLPTSNVTEAGDFTTGVIHLSLEDAQVLSRMIHEFAEAHSAPGENTIPWEYGIVTFPHSPSTDAVRKKELHTTPPEKKSTAKSQKENPK